MKLVNSRKLGHTRLAYSIRLADNTTTWAYLLGQNISCLWVSRNKKEKTK